MRTRLPSTTAKVRYLLSATTLAAMLTACDSQTGPEKTAEVVPPLFNHVAPVIVAGNPSCPGLGYAVGFKPQPEPPPSGTYTSPDGYLTVTITSDGTFFDWSSDRGVDAVIVKGGPNANVYAYDPPAEETSDNGLSSPINNNNNQPFAISHLEFCYDYEVDVTKDAEAAFTRTWNWTIDKSADQTDLLLSDGQLFQVNYEVMVSAAFTDSDWGVSGAITVANNTPVAATIENVTDVVSPAIAATVDCGVTFPHVLAAGGSLTCTYATALPDGTDRTNTATVTTSGSVGGGEATADVVFGDPTTVVDECIDVSDTNLGVLGTVCADEAPTIFQYSLLFGKHPDADVLLECGDNSHTNTASFTSNDTGATGEDSWMVNANVACEAGCTLTPGYWKTHSANGPAPFDDTWNQLPNAHDTPFFLSGKSYYQVLWTPPQGNAYYILAHAYIATELNQLNGADIPAAVLDAFNQATALFSTYTPAQVAGLKGPAKQPFIALATILDDYNNGITGPGHCSENATS